MPDYLISCEHATCTVPQSCRGVFGGLEELLCSPAGWDPGALNLAQAFAIRLRTPLLHTEITRLLLDVEQSGDDRWSPQSRMLPEATQALLFERFGRPYLDQLDGRIRDGIRRHGSVWHLMVHTDPDSSGQVLLDVPDGCAASAAAAGHWAQRMRRDDLRVKVRVARPGTPLACALRQRHGDGYIQLRLAVSQGFFLEGLPWCWSALKKHLLETLVLAGRQASVVV